MAGKQDRKSMNQYENSKQAMANIYAIEDAKDIFEAIGALNDDTDPALDPSMGDDPFNPADLLSVTPASTDPSAFNGAFDAPAEPSEEDQRFVVDRFAEELSKVKKDTVNLNDIAPIAAIIQDEVGTKMNVSDYLEKMMLGAHERLGSQNVSEAQPTGADANADAAAAAPEAAPVGALGDMGTPALDAAPGGIAPEPSLETNPGDDLGLGAIPVEPDAMGELAAEPDPAAAGAEGDDLGLGAITDDTTGLGDLGAEEPAAEGGDAAGTDDIFADGGLDGLSDDALGGDDGAVEGGDEATADEEPAIVDDKPEGEPAVEDDAPAGDESAPAADDVDDEVKFEAEMAEDRAILESLHAQYVEDMARKKIKALTEAFVLKQSQKAKKAQMESVIDSFDDKKSEAVLESVAADKRNELAAKLESVLAEQQEDGASDAADADTASKQEVSAEDTAGQVSEECNCGAKPETECADKPETECAAKPETECVAKPETECADKPETECADKPETECAAKLESIVDGFAEAERKDADRSRLLAKLESISATYHANEEKAAKLEAQKRTAAKLESIVQNFKKPAAENAPAKSSLEQKLDSIVASVK